MTNATPLTAEEHERLSVEPIYPSEWDSDEYGTRCPECGEEWVNGTDEHREQVKNSLHLEHLNEDEEQWARNAQEDAERATENLDRRATLGLGTEADDKQPN